MATTVTVYSTMMIVIVGSLVLMLGPGVLHTMLALAHALAS